MLVNKEAPGRGFQRNQGLTMHRVGSMGFRTLCAILSMTFLLAGRISVIFDQKAHLRDPNLVF